MNGLVYLLVIFVVLAGLIVPFVKYLRKPSYHGQGYGNLAGREGFIIRASKLEGDMRVGVNGENWRARSASKHIFSNGDKIIVKSYDSLEKVLVIEQLDEQTLA